jgi:uncharacterized protein
MARRFLPADVVTFLFGLPHNLKYRILTERLAVYRLAADAPFPASALESGFFGVARTHDELSVVCSEERVPDDALAERGWVALKLEGPFPFSMTGVLASFLQPLAKAQISIFAISTFGTDYVLIKHTDLKRAVPVLGLAGHEEIRD